MDDARFDALSRRLGAPSRSRRSALTLLAGGLGTFLGQARSTPTNAAKRKPRRQRKQDQVTASVIGLACRQAVVKGPVRGQKCGIGNRFPVAKHHPPHGCCPGSTCMSGTPLVPITDIQNKKVGFCYCNDGYEEDPEHQGFCRPIPPRPCVNLNVACNALDVCCQYPTGGGGVCTGNITDGIAEIICGIDCAIVDPQKGTTRCDTQVGALVAQCCKEATWDCETDCQCCGSLRCQNRRCVPPPNVCHSVGDSCADGEPCCAGAGTCLGGRCCLADLVSCPAGCGPGAACAACCGGFCFSNGQCGPTPSGPTPPPTPPCQAYGQPCTTASDCCNGVTCLGPEAGGQRRCRYD